MGQLLKLFRCVSRYFIKLPLGVLLTVPFVLQLLLAVGIISYLSYQGGQRSIDALVAQLMTQVAVRIDDRLNNYLEIPWHIVEWNRRAMEAGDLDPRNTTELEKAFFGQIQAFESLSTINFGTAQGKNVGVGRDKTGLVSLPNSIGVWQTEKAGSDRLMYRVDSQRRRIELVNVTPNFDPRQRTWYQTAVQQGQQSWDSVGAIAGIPIAAIAATAPIVIGGELQGVISSQLLLPDISLFLASLNFSPSGQAFIMERSGQLVANSTQEPAFIRRDAAHPLIRLKAEASQDAVTRAAAQAIFTQWHERQIQSLLRFQFTLDGQQYFGQVVPYEQSGLEWLTVTVVPQADFTEEIQANNRRTLLLSALTLLAVAGFGILTARLLTVPIRQLQQAADAMSQGRLDYSVQPSGIGEVAKLSEAFDRMARQLDRSFRSLRASEQRFATLLNNTPIGISVIDPMGKIVLANQKANAILSNETGVGLSLEQFMETTPMYIAGTAQPYPIYQLPAILALQGKTTSVDDFEIEVQGKRIPLEIFTIPVLDEDNQVIYAITAFQDITERRQAEQLRVNYEQVLKQQVAEQTKALRDSEERFRQAFNSAPIGIALITLDGYFFQVNHTLSEILGYSETEFLKLTLGEITHPDDREADTAYLNQMLNHEIRLYQTEKRCINKRDELISVQLNVSLVKDQANVPLYFIAQIQDISNRYEVDRMKDEFISIVSHELRTPLTAICGSLEILHTGILDQEQEESKELLQIALTQSHRLMRLVNDILTLERLESGRVQLLMEACEISHLIQQAIEAVRSMASDAGITLSTAFFPMQIWAAPDAIVQTLINLLSNAVRFSDAGSTIWLSIELPSPALPDAESYVLFAVSDQGRGIPDDKIESIFGRFQQVDASDSREKGGTGLGLAICQTIVHQHGGRIWVESRLNQGSTFYFTIPVKGKGQ